MQKVQLKFPDAEIILNKGVSGNAIEALYPIGDQTQERRFAEIQRNTFSHMDWAMLEEWDKLDMQDKCRVMGFMAQLDKEKKSDRATTA